jgi:hypothetical protein
MRYADSRCEIVESYKPEHTYTFVGPCLVTGKEQRVTVKAQDLFRYRQGSYVQDAFPYLDEIVSSLLVDTAMKAGSKSLAIQTAMPKMNRTSDPILQADYAW